MSDPLITYMQDHLAGAMHAIEVLKAMRDHHKENPLGQFAAGILADVEADREVLAGLVQRAGATPGGVKEWSAWLAEKVSRLKLNHGSAEGLGTFEALEFLVTGIHGKWALWNALNEIKHSRPFLLDLNFETLIAGAESQHDQVNAKRLSLAPSALSQEKH